MTLIETIEQDYQSAFRVGNKNTISVLRMLKTALVNAEIAKRGKTGDRGVKLSEDEALNIVKRQVKQTEEARDLFIKGGRQDLVDQNTKELDILKKYLPETISEDAVRAVVIKIVDEARGADFGKIMSAAMKDLKGKADGAIVSRVVKEMMGG